MSEKLLILRGSPLSELALSKELLEPTENRRISTGVGGPAITAAAAANQPCWPRLPSQQDQVQLQNTEDDGKNGCDQSSWHPP